MVDAFELSIPIIWHYVRDVRARVREALLDHPPDLRDATVMVASELVENAIKYGESVPRAPNASIKFGVDAERVSVEVSNGVSSDDAVRDVEEHIDRIASARSSADLYVGRVEELLHGPSTRGKLGLYRIGHEGGFDLRCTYEDRVLTVTATRGIT